MKRIFILTMALLGLMGKAMADRIVINDVIVPQSGQVTLEIGFSFDSGQTYTACQFDLDLPDEVSTLKDAANKPIAIPGNALSSKHTINLNSLASGDDRFMVIPSLNKEAINGPEGVILSVTLNASAELSVGSNLTAVVKNIKFTTVDTKPVHFDDVIFNITIGEPIETRVVLDEMATIMPESATNVDVRVVRTFKAYEWSTLVLPFAMTETQVKDVFGENVELAEFTSWSSGEDAEGNINYINIECYSIHEIAANHPCLIKTKADMEEFTMDDVNIEVERDPTVQVGTKKAERGYFIGSYVAGELIPEECLFLNGSEFIYSTGDTPIRGLYAYFEFADVLTSIEDAKYNVRLFVDGRLEIPMIGSSIQGVELSNIIDKSVYSIDGVYRGTTKNLHTLPKGFYIVNGKKMFVK